MAGSGQGVVGYWTRAPQGAVGINLSWSSTLIYNQALRTIEMHDRQPIQVKRNASNIIWYVRRQWLIQYLYFYVQCTPWPSRSRVPSCLLRAQLQRARERHPIRSNLPHVLWDGLAQHQVPSKHHHAEESPLTEKIVSCQYGSVTLVVEVG